MGDGSGWWENPESLHAGLLIIPSPSPTPPAAAVAAARRTCSSAPRAGSPGRAIRHPPWGNAHTEHTFCLHLFLFFYNGSHGFPSKNKRAAGKKAIETSSAAGKEVSFYYPNRSNEEPRGTRPTHSVTARPRRVQRLG